MPLFCALSKIVIPFRRMKREVASSLVERGVAERVRLTQAFEKKKAELQRQHDTVKSQLNDHKDKVCSNIGKFILNNRFQSKSFTFCVFVFRPEHYLKKIVNLGHASRPKDF